MSLLDSLRGRFAKRYDGISPTEAQQRVAEGAVLLDVREADEWRAGHVQGARHIPLGQLPQRASGLPLGRPVITVCRSGARSARAAGLLAGRGVAVSNLTGGLRAWQQAGLPVVGPGGRPGAVI
jgi:rhodanese-related sulfurtransferase